VLIIPSYWGSQRAVTYKPSTSFLAPLSGSKKTSARGVSHAQSFTLFLFCFIFYFFACIFLSKIQKNSSFIVAFSFARMGTPENTKLCDFTSTKNNHFICTPIAPPTPEEKFMRSNLLC
jgi:hypothetical protein